MYKGEGGGSLGISLVGENITISHITDWTKNYETDESVATVEEKTLQARVRKLRKKERELFEGKYNIEEMLAIKIAKHIDISLESTFVRKNIKYKIVHIDDNQLSYQVLYAENV